MSLKGIQQGNRKEVRSLVMWGVEGFKLPHFLCILLMHLVSIGL